MSGWRLVTRELYNASKPMLRADFAENKVGGEVETSLRYAKALGLVESRRPGLRNVWSITDKGRDWCEGRISIQHIKPRSQGGKWTACATWLAALPGRNEVRL
jgi:hypothetical protein